MTSFQDPFWAPIFILAVLAQQINLIQLFIHQKKQQTRLSVIELASDLTIQNIFFNVK